MVFFPYNDHGSPGRRSSHPCTCTRFSPLKKEVNEVIKKQENLKSNDVSDTNGKNQQDICLEVARLRHELSSFNAEKSQLEMEQCELELRLKVVGLEKEDLRLKLRALIQDLDEQNKSLSNNVPDMKDLIQSVSQLINESGDFELEPHTDTNDHNNKRTTSTTNIHKRLGTSRNQLKRAQQQLEQMKINDTCSSSSSNEPTPKQCDDDEQHLPMNPDSRENAVCSSQEPTDTNVLQTLDLHEHFQSLENDIRDTVESRRIDERLLSVENFQGD